MDRQRTFVQRLGRIVPALIVVENCETVKTSRRVDVLLGIHCFCHRKGKFREFFGAEQNLVLVKITNYGSQQSAKVLGERRRILVEHTKSRDKMPNMWEVDIHFFSKLKIVVAIGNTNFH